MTGPLFRAKILVLPPIAKLAATQGSRSVKLPIARGKSPGRVVRRVGHSGTASDRPVEAAASPAEKQIGCLAPNGSLAKAKIIHRGQKRAFLVDSLIKAVGALKKNPGQSTRPGSTELLPQLRLLAGRQGCRGMGCRPTGLIRLN